MSDCVRAARRRSARSIEAAVAELVANRIAVATGGSLSTAPVAQDTAARRGMTCAIARHEDPDRYGASTNIRCFHLAFGHRGRHQAAALLPADCAIRAGSIAKLYDRAVGCDGLIDSRLALLIFLLVDGFVAYRGYSACDHGHETNNEYREHSSQHFRLPFSNGSLISDR
jgi:hypothetical protein